MTKITLFFYLIAYQDIFKTSKTEFPQKTVDERLKETENIVQGVRIPYQLDTKYYNAKVDFWLDELTDPKPEEIQAYTQAEEVTQVIDAFVFCFEKSKVNTYIIIAVVSVAMVT
jgi:DNA gyrase/topoisomerase IV subunit B